jgi:hypothetical protein
MKTGKLIYGMLGLVVLIGVVLVFGSSFMSVSPSVSGLSEGAEINGWICVQKNNEAPECKHNLLYNNGRNITRTFFQGTDANANITTLALCNGSATNGCGTPVAAGNEGFVALTDCGMANTSGTFTDYGITGNWTVSNTFTSATCATSMTTNVTRLQNASSSIFAGSTFTAVTLDPQQGDQLTINWTIGVT